MYAVYIFSRQKMKSTEDRDIDIMYNIYLARGWWQSDMAAWSTAESTRMRWDRCENDGMDLTSNRRVH